MQQFQDGMAIGYVLDENATPQPNPIRIPPELLLDQGENVHTSDAIGPDTWYASEGVWVGGNMPEGVFLFSGPSFRSEGLGERARIVDLAPTLLHTMGASVPTDVDGTVLDVFDPDSEPAARDVTYRDPLDRAPTVDASDDASMEQRLADLGYLE